MAYKLAMPPTHQGHISLKGEKLVITFRFDPKVVALVRSIDGRLFNPKEKHWEIPKENIEEALNTLIPAGFTPTLEVKQHLERLKAEREKIDSIKTSNDQPYTGKLPLFDFQRKGAAFLKNMPAALLADVPGLGKSIQSLAATEHEDQVVIWCPASLKYSWDAEIKKWFPEALTLVIDGDKDTRKEQWVHARDPRYKYIIANYELLIHDFDHLKDHLWGVAIADEATRISNPEAKSVRNLKMIKFKKRIALTGTPISNKPDDIYSIMDWLVPGYLGTYYQFRSKYCILDEDSPYAQIIGYHNIEELGTKVGRFMLRRTKEEVFNDFPPKMVEDVVVSLTEPERKVYQSIKNLLYKEIHALGDLDTRTLAIIPVKMLRLKQCTNHLELVDTHNSAYIKSTKFETLKEMLRPIMANGDKAIIFTQFAEMLHIMARDLGDEFRPLTIYGGVSAVERMIKVKEFNDDPKPRVIIMTEAGAYGLNMQSASYVIHYDMPWSIAKLQQREDRAHRIGNKKPVTVYNMIAKDTIDEYVAKVLKRKNKVAVDILKDQERLGEMDLSAEDIREILRL